MSLPVMPSLSRAGQIDRQPRAEFERRRAFFLPLFVLRVKRGADFFRSGGQDFVHEPRGQRAGRDGVHVHVKLLQFLGQGFHEADDGGLGRGIGADVGQRIGRPAAAQDDDLAAAGLFEMRNDRAARQQDAVKIDVHRAPPFVERNGFGRPHRAVNAGVQHERVRVVDGYLADDPRPPVVRTLEQVAALAAEHGTVGLELSLGTQASDRMVGEPTTYTKAWFDAFPGAVDATPALVEARARKTAQEIERMRLANEIAAAAMDHARGVIRPGMTEAQIAAEWLGFVHGEGTGWAGKVELALGFSLVWAGRGIKTFTATSNLPVVEGEPTLFEIWVCADGYWADHTKNLVVGEFADRYRELEDGLREVYDDAVAFCVPGRASPSSTVGSGRESAASGIRASRPIRSATASARAPTSRRIRTRRRAASSPRAWFLQSSQDATGRAAADCGSRTTS